MGPSCQVCDEPLGWSIDKPPHVCDPKRIIERVQTLEQQARESERKLEDIRNGVLMLLQSLPSLEPMIVEVETALLRKLWASAQLQWWEAKTADNFHSRWMATHRILCEAFDLFRSKRFGKVETTLEKLTNLRKACNEAQEILGYQDSNLDMSPEDVINANGRSS